MPCDEVVCSQCSKPCAWVVSCETLCDSHYQAFLSAMDYLNLVCPSLLPDDAFDGVADGWIAPYDPTQVVEYCSDEDDYESEPMEVTGWPYSDEISLLREPDPHRRDH